MHILGGGGGKEKGNGGLLEGGNNFMAPAFTSLPPRSELDPTQRQDGRKEFVDVSLREKKLPYRQFSRISLTPPFNIMQIVPIFVLA